MPQSKEAAAALEARLAKMRERMSKVDMGGNKGFWSPPAGDSVIRILPEVGNMEEGVFWQEVGSHYITGGDKDTSVNCPAFTTSGQHECPICELVEQLWKGNEDDKALAKKLRHDRKFWMNVVVREKDDEGGNTGDGPFIFTPGVTIFGNIQALVNNPMMGDITDIDFGLDLIINKKGEKINTEYKVFNRATRIDIPLHKDEERLNKILDSAQDLSWVMLSEDPEEDKALGEGHIIKLLPYNRMLDEYGIGVGMDVSKLAAQQPKSTGSGVRDAIRNRRGAGEEVLPVTEANTDEVGAQFRQMANRRGR